MQSQQKTLAKMLAKVIGVIRNWTSFKRVATVLGSTTFLSIAATFFVSYQTDRKIDDFAGEVKSEHADIKSVLDNKLTPITTPAPETALTSYSPGDVARVGETLVSVGWSDELSVPRLGIAGKASEFVRGGSTLQLEGGCVTVTHVDFNARRIWLSFDETCES